MGYKYKKNIFLEKALKSHVEYSNLRNFPVSLMIVFCQILILYTALQSMFLQIHSIRSHWNGVNSLHTIFKTSVFKRPLNFDTHSYFCHTWKHLFMCPGNSFFWNCQEGAELQTLLMIFPFQSTEKLRKPAKRLETFL